ncbi:MAG: hypothetical protein D6683_03880 [Actinomyces sp.]|nr:MAG: hypothetical protein D6683_03880 [Actinomyces sp.]
MSPPAGEEPRVVGGGEEPRVVVDAMNVMGAVPDGWWRDRDAALTRLVDALRGRVADGTLDGPVLVVADGTRVVGLDAGPRDGVEVRWASRSGPDAADDDIVAVVESLSGPVVVVTSDAALARRVRERGAAVEGARRFRRRVGV